MKPNILITGSAGYLGAYLVPFLAETRDYNLHLFFEDLTESDFSVPDVETVIHLAGKPNSFKGDQSEISKTNLQGTVNLINQCPRDVHFIFLSSDYVFRNHPSRVYRENDAPEPDTIYGRSKADAEAFLIQSCLRWTILRTSMLYGYTHPRRQNFFRFVQDILSQGKTLELFTDVYSQPTHIRDLAMAIRRVLEQKLVGIFHACGQEIKSRYELGQLICQMKNYDPRLLLPVNKPESVAIPGRVQLYPSTIFYELLSTNLETGVAQ